MSAPEVDDGMFIEFMRLDHELEILRNETQGLFDRKRAIEKRLVCLAPVIVFYQEEPYILEEIMVGAAAGGLPVARIKITPVRRVVNEG